MSRSQLQQLTYDFSDPNVAFLQVNTNFAVETFRQSKGLSLQPVFRVFAFTERWHKPRSL
jgi:hypothetical protein